MSNATIDPKAIVREVLDPELKFVNEDVTSDLHRAGLTYLADCKALAIISSPTNFNFIPLYAAITVLNDCCQFW